MANYFEMNRDELVAEKAKLEEQYKNFQAMGLKLNMARGKPGPHPMPAPTPATTAIWRVCTRPASCLRMSLVSSPQRSLWAATPACS